MKIISKILTLSIVISLPIFAQASTDWTPLLNNIQDSCKHPKENDDGKLAIPVPYKNSIASNKFSGMFEDGKQTIMLKDATAFGSPLHKIYREWSIAGSKLVLSFGNNNFMKVLPQFYYKDDSMRLKAGGSKKTIKKEYAEYTTRPDGYTYYETSQDVDLTFNANKKTLECRSSND